MGGTPYRFQGIDREAPYRFPGRESIGRDEEKTAEMRGKTRGTREEAEFEYPIDIVTWVGLPIDSRESIGRLPIDFLAGNR